jgi:hypothetical protein
VKTQKPPDTVIPTDDDYKTESKKVDKPPKEETVEKKIARSRFT